MDAAVREIAMKKKAEICKHFLAGKCRMPAQKCKYAHDGEAAQIACALPVKNGKCLLGDKCPYLHASSAPMDQNCKYYASTKPP